MYLFILGISMFKMCTILSYLLFIHLFIFIFLIQLRRGAPSRQTRCAPDDRASNPTRSGWPLSVSAPAQKRKRITRRAETCAAWAQKIQPSARMTAHMPFPFFVCPATAAGPVDSLGALPGSRSGLVFSFFLAGVPSARASGPSPLFRSRLVGAGASSTASASSIAIMFKSSSMPLMSARRSSSGSPVRLSYPPSPSHPPSPVSFSSSPLILPLSEFLLSSFLNLPIPSHPISSVSGLKSSASWTCSLSIAAIILGAS